MCYEFKRIKTANLGQLAFLFYLQKKGLCVLFNYVPEYYGASATVNPPKNGSKKGAILVLLSDFLMICCSSCKIWYFHLQNNRSHNQCVLGLKQRQFSNPCSISNRTLKQFLYLVFFLISPLKCISCYF